MNVRPYQCEDWHQLCAVHDAARRQALR
ncbi:histone acetyltransferase, partial [Xanthomonas oryzae pv. oryzae]